MAKKILKFNKNSVLYVIFILDLSLIYNYLRHILLLLLLLKGWD